MSLHMGLEEIENALLHLNYRWTMDSLAVWKGEKPIIEPYRVYEGYEKILDLELLGLIETVESPKIRRRLKYTWIDHYLQRFLLPHETEMRGWMRGAAAHVNGKKIYFRDIIPWCQKESTREERIILQKEVGPLCKFLKPFAINYWELLLKILKDTFGFESYISYCTDKKMLDYQSMRTLVLEVLSETDDIYFPAMQTWVKKRFGVLLQQLTRFDAICILGLGEFDDVFPKKDIEKLTEFFRYWNIDLENTPGLHLDLENNPGKSAQAMCFILQIPDEVYVLVKPQGGWSDLETVWHELGHGLFAAFTSPDLEDVIREMTTSNCLSETYAFLLQNIAISVPFLTEVMGLNHNLASEIYYYKVLKDLSIFRRYAARFLSEYEMFSTEQLGSGEFYSHFMTQYTGFYYQPESALFDLVPEFYSLDYVMAWMAEATLEKFFKREFGDSWMFRREVGEQLKSWWREGNTYELSEFLDKNNFGPLSARPLLERWNSVLTGNMN